MTPRLQWRRYRRRFRQPLQVSGHTWSEREGIIIRWERQDDSVGYGEIAPVPWFPVESFSAAEGYLEYLRDSDSMGFTRIPPQLPCTAFALSSALMGGDTDEESPQQVATLLPAGERALDALKAGLAEGLQTFKWKIGVLEAAQEWSIAKALGALLEGHGKLRLDANGGLTLEQLAEWGTALKGLPVDYIEQPLPVGMEAETAEWCHRMGLPFAFDESVCDLNAFQRLRASIPDAIYVIKPSQFGAADALKVLLKSHPAIHVIISWAFETPIGFASVKSFASEFCSYGAPGFGTQDAFEPDLFSELSERPGIREMEALWRRL